MRAKEPTWTDERLERLKNRFEAGLTCREIADDIGVSRNAVIGKLSRLDLTREKNGDARRKRMPRRAAARKRCRGCNTRCSGHCMASRSLRLTSRSIMHTAAHCWS
jgi:GcrA cell cycle regulator